MPLDEDFGTEDKFFVSPEEQKRMEDERIFGEIISRESQALRRFFGKEIPVPAIPKQATRERILEWRQLGFELHYLPPISLAEIKRDPEGKILEVKPIDFPGWKKKPGARYTPDHDGIDFFHDVEFGYLDPSALELPGAWILVDTREKPNYDHGEQMYANDPFAPALEELRKEKIVKDFKIKGSRFNLSYWELEKTEVLQAFADALNLRTISGLTIGIPRAIEFNILGNIHYPQWGKGNTNESFSDRGASGCLRGGRSNFGGLSYITWFSSRDPDVGFRVIGRFSSNL
ncbi:MAG TPA: hypothetical protein VFQ60_00900 [Patescibacteria group bacterium]|nr:hypothetical protein [Patescibacteria group bacterium]